MNNPESPDQLTFDLQSGMDYLAGVTLADPVAAEQQLIFFIDSLLAAPPPPGILFSLLEQARVPVCFVEEEISRLYHNKPLTLNEKEEAAFQRVVSAWHKMHSAYVMCAPIEDSTIDSAEHSSILAPILHRCIYYTGMIIIEHYRARRELPDNLWLNLHGLYRSAEEWGVAYMPVEDSLENNFQATHCAAAYTTLLLIDIASPYSNSVRNLNLIRRWANMWAPLISIHPLDDDLEIPPYLVELSKDAPLHPSALVERPGIDARRLDTTRLGLQINHMISQLRQRIPPSQLGLGEETSGHVTELLERLSRPWTQSASPRKFRRYASEGIVRVAVGFDAMHFFVTGKEFTPPASASTYSRGKFDQLFTFGDRVNSGENLTISPNISFPISDWSVINHSASGFRLACSEPQQKIFHGQLLAIHPHDGEHFLLAQVNWSMQEASGGIIIGVAVLPGIPSGIGARFAAGKGANNDRLTQAFLLPPIPALSEESTIVLPSGMFHSTRTLDVFSGDNHLRLRMRRIAQRGTDFDRITFEGLQVSSEGDN